MSAMIYLDNAATSWPKPPCVIEAMAAFYEDVGANPGRSGHIKSVEAGRIINDAREKIAQLVGLLDPLRVVFGANATEGLNMAIYGLLRPGDHVITASMEHNSVMRPLRHLEQTGVITLSVARVSPTGVLDPGDVQKALNSKTRMIVLNHASNVTGCVLPVRDIGTIAGEHGIMLLVDGAQSLGALPVDMQRDKIDLLAFTGHKALMGPTGTGGLLIGPRVMAADIQPLKRGGTGSRSEHEQQPDFLPDMLESGTLNAVGIAGLLAAMEWIQDLGLETIQTREKDLIRELITGLEQIPGVRIYKASRLEAQTGTVSFNIDGLSPSDVGLRLDEEFGILCRVGLHCAPSAHGTIGTFPSGTVRFAIGFFTTDLEIQTALGAVAKIAGEQ